jgi:hypothetical protein
MGTQPETLLQLAKVLRSKNSGPFEITFDVLFEEEAVYQRVKQSGALQAADLARRFHVELEDVLVCMFFDPARAFKLTLKRNWKQGSIGERDTFGAQQHAPLFDIVVPEISVR